MASELPCQRQSRQHWLILAISSLAQLGHLAIQALSFILHGAQRALPCSRALRALLHDLNITLLQYISNILITYLFKSVPSCFISYEPRPGLCPSLAVSPGERSSPLDLPFPFCLSATRLIDDGFFFSSQLRSPPGPGETGLLFPGAQWVS